MNAHEERSRQGKGSNEFDDSPKQKIPSPNNNVEPSEQGDHDEEDRRENEADGDEYDQDELQDEMPD